MNVEAEGAWSPTFDRDDIPHTSVIRTSTFPVLQNLHAVVHSCVTHNPDPHFAIWSHEGEMAAEAKQ